MKCDRCDREAKFIQAKYRGNSDDRHGPLVLYRCEDHAVVGLTTERLT